MLSWIEYKTIRRKYFGETKREEIREGYNRYKMAKQDCSQDSLNVYYPLRNGFQIGLAPLSCTTQAAPWPEKSRLCEMLCEIKKEGKTPMKNYNDSYACASVSTAKSDTAVTRDYLLNRLDKASYPKRQDFEKLFNLGVDNQPNTFVKLIEAIKGGKYTVDPKVEKTLAASEANGERWYGGAFHGIIWDGPKEDYEGYGKAVEEMNNLQVKTRDQIMVKDGEAGLAALEAFEAWTPTVATTTVN